MKNILLTIVSVGALLGQCQAQGSLTQTTSAQADAMHFNKITSDTTSGTLLYKAEPKVLEAPWYVEKFSVSAGFFFAFNSTDVTVNSPNRNLGNSFSFENDLGYLQTSPTFLGDLQWRISRRSKIDLSYFGINRSKTRTLQRDIDFGDNTYDINTTVNTFFNTNVYRLSYGYAFFTGKKGEFGAMIGFHIVRASVGIGIVGQNINKSAGNDYAVTAPLPDVGLWGGYVLGPRWALTGEIGYLALTISNINGRIATGNFGLTYNVVNNLKATLGYNGFNFKVTAKENDLDGSLKWGYNGPSLAITFAFGSKGWQ
jgi:hypothetical protein